MRVRSWHDRGHDGQSFSLTSPVSTGERPIPDENIVPLGMYALSALVRQAGGEIVISHFELIGDFEVGLFEVDGGVKITASLRANGMRN
ncbi:hypothetical protein [Methylorubrum sp. SL192]|uniref:hypothetical protein n=1 Tax=Methylorubrum sp. SL192 TaxID=2995167 RepID=UPI002274AB59|nr:hypothetical protein [Methylorubrum sp. SL192]MCY1641633.1 hypothetical protein [Methylorubrum sp. SL192]